MFENFIKRAPYFVLPLVVAAMLAGCEEDQAVDASGTESVDLAQTQDLFSQPIQPNPLTADPNAVVVRVNGEDITRGEILQVVGAALQRMGGQVPAERMQQVQGQLYEQFKNDLINKKLLDAAVAAANVVVADADVAAELDKIRERIPEGQDLESALAAQGMTLEELTENLKKDMATRQFLESQVEGIADVAIEEAQEFYDSNPDQFNKPENVTASHILIQFGDDETDESKAEKKAELEKIRADILAGTVTFEDAAMENSDCPSSARGGNLGTFGKGQMVPEFELAAFTQEVGEVGDIVETQFGYHIIKVTDHQDEGKVDFDEAKDQLIAYLTSQKKQQAISDYVEGLRDSATIEEVAQ